MIQCWDKDTWMGPDFAALRVTRSQWVSHATAARLGSSDRSWMKMHGDVV
jgi:hypothetical protein